MEMIYAIIVLYNPDMVLLEKEYESIVNQVDGIVYVDNSSNNKDFIEKWALNKANAMFIFLSDNEGLSYAQNRGIERALNNGAGHIVIFDQDSVINEGFVSALLDAEKKAISNGINVGITGPVYYSYDDNFFYPIRSVIKGKVVKISLDEFHDYYKVSHIIASGQMIKREVLEKVGLMREDYFIGYIDYDYCFRVLSAKYEIIVAKSAVMHHKMGDSQVMIFGRKIGIYSPFRRYFDCRNTILIQRDKIIPRVLRLYFLKILIGKIFVSVVYGPHRIKQFKFCLRGLYDGIRNIRGKFE